VKEMTQEELDKLVDGGYENHEEVAQEEHDDHHVHMAEQLGNVTKESEIKATEIFDKLESILQITEQMRTASKEEFEEQISSVEHTIMDIMSTMQYQDIHRQKIERVINNMRSISKLMNQTLHIVDDDIAPSAKHIDGDDTDDVVSDEELEALVASMNNK
jgi:phosphoenolpyruvate carboxylase